MDDVQLSEVESMFQTFLNSPASDILSPPWFRNGVITSHGSKVLCDFRNFARAEYETEHVETPLVVEVLHRMEEIVNGESRVEG